MGSDMAEQGEEYTTHTLRCNPGKKKVPIGAAHGTAVSSTVPFYNCPDENKDLQLQTLYILSHSSKSLRDKYGLEGSLGKTKQKPLILFLEDKLHLTLGKLGSPVNG